MLDKANVEDKGVPELDIMSPRVITTLDKDVLQLLKSQLFTVSLPTAVRELVQNSVDAKADRICVTVDLDDLAVLVRDNGLGMTPEDLDQLGTANMTSKLGKLADLKRLQSYGFRGDALYNIANTSKMTIVSKVPDHNGTWTRVLPGPSHMMSETRNTHNEFTIPPFGLKDSGTAVLVEDLFYNLPVRKIAAKEVPTYKIINTIKEDMFQILLAHPTISLKIYHNRLNEPPKLLLESSGLSPNCDIFHSIPLLVENIFGTIVPRSQFKKISLGFSHYRIQSMVAKRAIASKNYQFIYLNKRRLVNDALLRIINSLFESVSFGYDTPNQADKIAKSVGRPYRAYPMFVVLIEGPQDIHDLLQSQTKNISKPSNALIVNNLILKVMKTFLLHQGYISSVSTVDETALVAHQSSTGPDCKSSAELPKFDTHSKHILDSKIIAAKILEKEIAGRFMGTLSSGSSGQIRFKPLRRNTQYNKRAKSHNAVVRSRSSALDIPLSTYSQDLEKLINKFKLDATDLLSCEVISQVDTKFILLRFLPNKPQFHLTLLVVDQHACDERIKLETLLREYLLDVKTGSLHVRSLDNFHIDINATEAEFLTYYKPEFIKWKIDYNITRDNNNGLFIKVIAIPELLYAKVRNDKQFLKKVLLQHAIDLKDHRKITFPVMKPIDSTNWWKYIDYIPVVFREIFNSKACRSAIMFGDILSKEECIALIQELRKCHSPFQCAHGRPSVAPLNILNVKNSGTAGLLSAKQEAIDYVVDTT